MARGRPRTEKTDPLGTHLTVFVDVELKEKWDSYCKELDLNSSQLMRRLIKDELVWKRWGNV
jgi:predicted transcriptional regulator